jgi:Uma2 family endonuclease
MSTGPTSAETTALLLESPRLLSVDEYHRMIEAGIFDEDERVELLEGVIVAMTPQKPGSRSLHSMADPFSRPEAGGRVRRGRPAAADARPA